LSNKFANGCQ